MTMKCEFNYCIYNRSFECVLDDIQINSLGMCEECMIVELDEAYLKKEKEKRLKATLSKK